MKCPTCHATIGRREVIPRYRYRESGLDDVYLLNLVTYRCACGERLLQLPHVVQLHDAIASELLTKPALLSGPEFRFLRKWVGLTAPQLAALLGVKTRITISRWENAKVPVTAAADHAMRLLVMRLNEEALKEPVFRKVAIQEQFKRISATASRRYRITISPATLRAVSVRSRPHTIPA
jgi:putative zinc finger/helix-turn-helix YgiT family protein